jgi:hypothetical protein
MRVKWTKDVSLTDLLNLRDELGKEFDLQIDETPRLYKGGVPPSWVRFLAEADWYIKVLGGYAALYVAEIVKEAAKETWKSRSKIISGAVGAGNRIKQFAIALANFRNHTAPETLLEIVVPFPDDYDGTILDIAGNDVDELAVQIAAFVHHLPALQALIRDEGLTRTTIATGIQLELLPDLSLKASWQDGSLKWQTRLLTFPDDGH